MFLFIMKKGQQLLERKIEHTSATHTYTIPVNSLWTSGMYSVHVTNEVSKKQLSIQFVISK